MKKQTFTCQNDGNCPVDKSESITVPATVHREFQLGPQNI